MANTEDYLDGLLNSITEAKNGVRDAADRERKARESEIRQRNRIGSDDDFMAKTGLNGYTPRKSSYKNLKEAFSESDFLREFESELDSGEADSFLEEFERELAEADGRDDSGFSIDEPERDSFSDDGAFTDDDLGDMSFLDDDDDISDEDLFMEDDDMDSVIDKIREKKKGKKKTADNTGDFINETPISGEIREAEKVKSDIDSDDLSMDDLEKLALAVGDEVGTEFGSAPVEKIPDAGETLQVPEDLGPQLEDIGEISLSEPEPELQPDDSLSLSEQEALPEESVGSIDDLLDIAAEKMSDESSEDSIASDIEGLGGLSDTIEKPAEDFLQPEFKPDALDLEDTDNLNQEDIERMLNGEDLDKAAPEAAPMEEADLMSLLSEDEADIADLLNADENGLELEEARDAFEASADGISLDALEDELESEDEKKKKKGGFFGNLIAKIKGFFAGGDDDEEDDGVVDIVENAPPEDLSDENAAILANFEDEAGANKGGNKSKKEKKEEDKAAKKAEKEAKKKEAAAEKEKKNKEKAEAKKRKAEEKARKAAAKPKDNSPKVNMKNFIPFVLLAASLIVLVLIAMKVTFFKSSMSAAQRAYANGDFITAYSKIGNIEVKKEEDIEFQKKTHLLAELQKKYQSYQILVRIGENDMALDELVNGYGRYLFNREEAKSLGISEQYEAIAKLITDQLMDEYGIGPERAEELYKMTDRTEYTMELIDILESHGLEVRY